MCNDYLDTYYFNIQVLIYDYNDQNTYLIVARASITQANLNNRSKLICKSSLQDTVLCPNYLDQKSQTLILTIKFSTTNHLQITVKFIIH